MNFSSHWEYFLWFCLVKMKTQQSDWLMAFLLRGKSVLFIQDFLYCFPREHCISSKTVISWHLTKFSKNSLLVRRSQHLSIVKFCRYDKAVSCKGQLAKARDRKTRLWNSLPENATIASQISASILSLPSRNFSIKKKKKRRLSFLCTVSFFTPNFGEVTQLKLL